MKYTGRYFEYGEANYRITDLIVTDTRIAMDWTEEGTPASVVAASTDGGLYRGNMGFPRPDAEGLAEFRVYRAKDGELLLFGRWWRTDNSSAGTWLIQCSPQAQADGKRRARQS